MILRSKGWAKITELREWKRAIPLRNIEDRICERLCGIDGYQREDGKPHFQMTLQVDHESMSKLLSGNVYPSGALASGGAEKMERFLPDGRTRDSGKLGKSMPEVNEEI